MAADRAAHSSLTHIKWKAYGRTENTMTKIMLHGMTNKPAAELAPLAKSWLYAPNMQLKSSMYRSEGYDPTQRAYVLACQNRDKPSKLEFTLAAGKASPVVNPAFVIKDWGTSGASLRVNGNLLARGRDLRFGHHRTVGSSNLIVWFKLESTVPLQISIVPVAD